MTIKKKKLKKKILKLGYNHGYGRIPNSNRFLVYFGIGLLTVSFGIAFYCIEYSDIPLADQAEYVNERVIVGQPSGFDIPNTELKNNLTK